MLRAGGTTSTTVWARAAGRGRVGTAGGAGIRDDIDLLLERIEPVRLLPYQRAAIRRPDRFTWNNWSRQTGKSFTFSLRRLLRGIVRGRDQLLLSAGERQSRELMRKIEQHCRQIGIAFTLGGEAFLEATAFRRLEARLPNGVRVVALPANPRTARGYTADVFLDEFAMHRDDRAIWAALLPTLLRGEGELDIASTPRGRDNTFARLGSNSRFAISTLTLFDAIAQGLAVDAQEMRAAMADERLFRQEFLCEFDDDDDALLPYELITACADARLSLRPDAARLHDRAAELFLGVDVGRRHDRTVVWLWERAREAFVTRGVTVLDRAPFAEQKRVLWGLLEHRSVRRVCIDATGMGLMLAEETADRFGRHRVEGVSMTPAVQSESASRLRVLLEEQRLRIPADEAILSDWHALRRVTSASGHVRFHAARTAHGHSDRFWAAALGLVAAAEPTDRGESRSAFGAPLQFVRPGIW